MLYAQRFAPKGKNSFQYKSTCIQWKNFLSNEICELLLYYAAEVKSYLDILNNFYFICISRLRHFILPSFQVAMCK